MFDTYVTVVGNVLTAPEWRRTKNTGSLVANFKVASTARRLDRETGKWVDGDSLRVRVNCWRRLAEGVAASVITGDPVIVIGRLYTRDWTDGSGNHRVMYELEAVAVGHDLSRGQAKFARSRPAASTSTVEDEQETSLVGGQPTEPVPEDEIPARRDDGFFDELGDGLSPLPVSPARGYGSLDALSGRGFRAGPVDGADDDDLTEDDDDLGEDDPDGEDHASEEDLLGAGLNGAHLVSDGLPSGRDPVGGDLGDGEPVGEDADGLDGADERPRRGRRRSRTPVPA
jgi:single-strand DNA-binding protein